MRLALPWVLVAALLGGVPATAADPTNLELGVLTEGSLAGGEAQSYGLRLAAGDFLQIEVEQRGIDVIVSLRASDGALLVEVDSPNGREGMELLRTVYGASLQASASSSARGMITLEVRSPSDKAPPGSYQVLWRLRRAASAEDRLRADSDAALRAGRLDVQGGAEALERAVDSLAQARDGYRQLGEEEHEAEALFHGSVAARRLGHYQKALELAQGAAALQQGSTAFRARLFNGIALIQGRLGEDEEALTAHDKALVLWRQMGSAAGEAATLHNLAVLRFRRGEDEEARDLYLTVLERWTALGEEQRRVSVLINLGHLHERRGELRLAVEWLRKALAIARKVEKPALLATALDPLAGAYAVLGDAESSITVLHESLQIRRRLGIGRQVAQTLNNLGWVYFAAGEPRRSLPFFEEAVRLTEGTDDTRDRASYTENLGRAHLASGESAAARRLIEKALTLSRAQGDERGVARRLEALGWVSLSLHEMAPHETSLLKDAEEVFVEAVESGHRLGEKTTESNARAGLSALYRRQGHFNRALEEIDESLRLVESIRGDAHEGDLRASFLALKRPLYEAKIDLLQELHGQEPQRDWDHRALEASERAKARTLLERLGAKGGAETLKTAEIQEQVLDGDTLLLELALGEERSFLWLVSKNSVESFELPSRRRIEEAGRALMEGLSRPPSQNREERLAVRRQSAELSDLLLGSVAQRLGDRRLLVVAEGVLLYLPFGALPDPRSPAGEPLLARHEVVTAPSASVLVGLRRKARARPPSRGTLAVLADPVFEGDARLPGLDRGPTPAAPLESSSEAHSGGFSLRTRGGNFLRLPASREEASAIAALVPEEDRLVALGFDASRELALGGALSDYRFLHFATHGVLDSRSPRLSALVLSQHKSDGQPVDGFLRLEDLDELRLSADMVVMSACSTALGKAIKGEGLLGLVRGFMNAGAPRIVASLWQVDDRATAALMERLYRNMLEEGLSAAAALRQAQLTLWRGDAHRAWRDPYFWAAFQLQGEWR